MLGRHEPQRELFRPDNVLLGHVGADSFFGLLSREGRRLFRDEDFAGMYGHRGRPSVPPSQLCVLLVLQTQSGVSDEEAIARTAFDLRWKVALGLELEQKLCAKSTLQLFRSKLVLHERYQQVFERSVAACREAGLLGGRRLEVAIDTTPVLGRGAVKDTFNLVSDAIGKVVGEACRLKGWEADAVVAAEGLERHFGSSFKGAVELDWSDEGERRALVGRLVGEARGALALANRALNGFAAGSARARALREARDLLGEVLLQDIDEAPDDGGGPRISRGTAKDRIVSSSDPQMRHGHKSHSKGFDGYKASVVADAGSGVILATDARGANVPDGERAEELIEAAGSSAGRPVARMLGDTAYGNLATREKMAQRQVEVTAKAPPAPSRGKTFTHESFRRIRGGRALECPAGRRSLRRNRVEGGWKYVFSRKDCNGCALRSACTTAKVGARIVTITTTTLTLNKLRRHQRTKAFRHRYRRRVVVEHRIGRLRQLGIGQARYLGRAKTALQIALAATVANLTLALAASRPARGARALLDLLTRLIPLPEPVPQMALSRPGL